MRFSVAERRHYQRALEELVLGTRSNPIPTPTHTPTSTPTPSVPSMGFIPENALSIPTCHHMVKTPAIFDPDRSCHSSLFKYMPRVCQDLLTDPYSFPHFGKVPIKAS